MNEETSPPAPLLYGRYEILEELGRGTSGVVYKARDPKLDRLVAMKILRPELVSLEESGVSLKQRFHQEAVAAGRLTHSAIVAVHDVGEADGRPFMIMEYIEGGTLADLLIGGRPLPLADAVAIVVQVCAALDYAHRHGVVHRDIKPRNILVGDGVTKVTDFGTARILGASHTQTGTMLGTPAYMSPEMVRGHSADPRSDLFSVGVVLYEALTGVNPFNAADLAAVLYRIVNTNAPPLRHHDPLLPPGLERVLRRALAKEPDARYATATDLANALREGATVEQRKWSLRTLREAAGDLRWIWLRARAAGAVALSLIGLVVLGAGAWAAFGRAPDVPQTTPARLDVTRSVETEARPVIPIVAAPADPGAAVAKAQEFGCLSVNALPFAQIYVDGQSMGYTPKACLRLAVGEHRVRFVTNGQRSPERLVRLTARHKPAAPLRLGYDFDTGQFIEK
jgi:predicted Ser/Thr protein kinase